MHLMAKAISDKLQEELMKVAMEDLMPFLEGRVEDGQTEDAGIFVHKGASYAYELSWHQEESEMSFALAITKVTPRTKTKVVERFFTQEV